MKNLTLFASSCFALFLWVHVSFAQSVPGSWEAQYDWTRQPWTGNDRAYVEARKSINKKLATEKPTKAKLATYEAASLRNLGDSLSRFKWALYAYNLALLQPDYDGVAGVLGKVNGVFFEETALAPYRSYEYSRRRFLSMSAGTGEVGKEMKILGERLLKRDPKDYHVKFYTARLLRTGSDAEELKAIRYSQEMLKEKPNDYSARSDLAFTYQHRWWRHHRPEDARKAIAGYKQYLNLAKPKGDQRRRIENSIKDLQQST